MSVARILIIAGSDSGGGAGIQADIKTVTMMGGHAMTAITAITAQNTLGVSGVHPIPTEMVLAQIDAVAGDIGVDAVKIGMIGSAETANAVADRLATINAPIVFDPVMVATSGAVLADAPTVAAFRRLMAMAAVATPNVPELQALAGHGDAEALARSTGCAVLAKGGHVPGDEITDRLVRPDGSGQSWTAPRIETEHSHGTGCTLASAIAVGLGQGLPLADAVERARIFVRMALREAPGLGSGHGPMGHQHVRLDTALGGPMLNQVTVAASDYDRSVAFYTALGLRQIVASPPRYARFETAGGATFSLHHVEAGELAGSTTIYFECADLDDRVGALKAVGRIFDHEPIDQDWRWREARLRDPFGNIVCLYWAGEDRRFPPWRIDQ